MNYLGSHLWFQNQILIDTLSRHLQLFIVSDNISKFQTEPFI